ncbi:MAG: hypothetical protein IJT18_01660 [Oscillospiraceae bacterium]|nr:hypothetical protein [Oscillospiraceae bacterium]
MYGALDPVRYPTLQDAFAAAENTSFLNELPEKVQQIAADNPDWFNYYPPTITLLQNVTVSTEITISTSETLDLNGHTLTVDENGTLSGSGWITIESGIPGVFTSCGALTVEASVRGRAIPSISPAAR